MVFNASEWFNQLYSVKRSLLRKIATPRGLSMIHVEIIEYLGTCNRHSNTMLTVTEYLGQTKGSVSQSLTWLEKRDFILRMPDENDKRITRLTLGPEGQKVFKEIEAAMPSSTLSSSRTEGELYNLVADWQAEAGFSGFGVCHTCRYNQKDGSAKFRCLLLEVPLKERETFQICREHRFPTAETTTAEV